MNRRTLFWIVVGSIVAAIVSALIMHWWLTAGWAAIALYWACAAEDRAREIDRVSEILERINRMADERFGIQ